MIDIPLFISPRYVRGSTVEVKVLQLLNSLNTVEDFLAIPDKFGTGYSTDREGYGVRKDTAENILAARPPEGFSSLAQIAFYGYSRHGRWKTIIPGIGRDTFTDIVVAAISLSTGSDHRTITGNFRTVNAAATGLADASQPLDQPYDVIAYGRFQGAAEENMIPIQVARQDANGNFILDHITDDFEQFALVAVFRNEEEHPLKFDLFHRSGLIPIRSYPFSELKYEPVLLNQSKSLSAAEFNAQVSEIEGTQTEGGEIIDRMRTTFLDGKIQFDGEIRKEDTLLFFDSTITFTAEMFLYPTVYTPNWVRDLSALVRASSRITEQEHSNDGFWIVPLALLLVPLIGPTLAGSLGIYLLYVDSIEDSNPDTKALLNEQLKISLGDEVAAEFAATIQNRINSASPIELIGLQLLSNYEDAPDDPVDALIEFMTEHKTVRSITITPEEMTFDAWLTLPFYLES